MGWAGPQPPRYDPNYWINGGLYGICLVGFVYLLANVLSGPSQKPPDALDVAVSGTHAYVAADGAGLHVFDVADPAQPRLVGSRAPPAGRRPCASRMAAPM